jgi:hypothetical protein
MAVGRKTGGRKKGTPNKLNATLKEMILNALSDVGGQRYLASQALESPGPFLALLGKVLPMQISGTDADGNPSEIIIRVIKPGN